MPMSSYGAAGCLRISEDKSAVSVQQQLFGILHELCLLFFQCLLLLCDLLNERAIGLSHTFICSIWYRMTCTERIRSIRVIP